MRPALLFRSSGFVSVTASMSARKSSHGTVVLIVSSGSPLALIASSRSSTSKKPACRTVHPDLWPLLRPSSSQIRAALPRSNFSRCPKHIGWNPNPRGSGFGHYPGASRPRPVPRRLPVRHLRSALVSTRDDLPLQPAAVVACREGTLAGSKGSQDWCIATGQAPPLEEEFTFQAPTDPGVNTLKVYFSEVGDGSDINRAQPLDEWSYRVSRYRNSIEHLNPSEGHPSRAFGPFGAMHIATPPAPPLPAGFDFPGSPAAQLRSGWALPSFVRSLSDLADPQSGLGFLRLAHWSGLLDAPDTG